MPEQTHFSSPEIQSPTSNIQDSLSEEWLISLRAVTTQSMIAASGLPPASQMRLTVQIEALPFATPQDVSDAIESEQVYLAALQEDRVIQLPGHPPRSPHITGMRDSLDRIGLAVEALIAGVHPPDNIQPLTGLRETYHLLSGDYEMSGLFHSDRVMFANVNSSTMAALVDNA